MKTISFYLVWGQAFNTMEQVVKMIATRLPKRSLVILHSCMGFGIRFGICGEARQEKAAVSK